MTDSPGAIKVRMRRRKVSHEGCGNGGGAGAAGSASTDGDKAGGAAGGAIDGVTNITFTVNNGTRTGSEIN